MTASIGLLAQLLVLVVVTSAVVVLVSWIRDRGNTERFKAAIDESVPEQRVEIIRAYGELGGRPRRGHPLRPERLREPPPQDKAKLRRPPSGIIR